MLGKQDARMHTDAAQLAASAEHFYKTSIKKHDPEFGVEHTEALRHLADGYRMQRENGAKFVVSALTVCPVNWSYHLSIAGRRTVLRFSNAFLNGKPKFRVKLWYTIWLTNSYRGDSKHFAETASQWQTDLHQVFSFQATNHSLYLRPEAKPFQRRSELI
jgi:hypothetical protein